MAFFDEAVSRALVRVVVAAAAATSVGAFGRAGLCEEPAKPPNVIYMMTDDQRWDDLSIMGHPILETPNMDRLAREGVAFSNMFVTNSLCAPSRATFLTGVYSHIHGVRTNHGNGWKGDQPIFTDHLRKAGYHTCFIGKAHRGADVLSKRFDFWLGYAGQGQYHNPPLLDFSGKRQPRQGYMTDLLTDLAIEYLREHRKDPFCLLLWFKAPHGPWTPHKRLARLYAEKKVPRPTTYYTDYQGKPEAVRSSLNVIGKSPIVRGPFDEWVRNNCRLISGVDQNVGRLLDVVDELRLTRDTIVVFTSDNGFFLGEHHFFDKRLMYEPSIRIPMLIRYPRLIPAGGRRISEMALNVDLAPTLLDLAGVPVPEDMQGMSWKPLLEGRNVPWRESWYYEYYEASYGLGPSRGVRTDRWKYIEYPRFRGRPPEYELYDLRTDPNEVKNLSHDPAHAATMKRLRREMARLRRDLGDPDLEPRFREPAVRPAAHGTE